MSLYNILRVFHDFVFSIHQFYYIWCIFFSSKPLMVVRYGGPARIGEGGGEGGTLTANKARGEEILGVLTPVIGFLFLFLFFFIFSSFLVVQYGLLFHLNFHVSLIFSFRYYSHLPSTSFLHFFIFLPSFSWFCDSLFCERQREMAF